MSFFGELRRRNVVKVAVAYAIVGWLLIEVTSTVFPLVQLPDWTATFVAMLILVGFPIALILSWAYELTPDGMKKSHEVEATESITHVTGRKIDFAIIGALVLALGFVVYNYVLEGGDTVAGVLPNSVAVLPFENMSVDPEEAFYASGIHEEILNQLVKLSALNVIARTSMQQYANTEKPIPEIARELNVETVMEGSVRYAGGQIRITAQLNDGVTGAHLWSETYTRDFEDIFAIESDVAMNVANAVGAEFSLAEQESMETRPTDSPEAYRFYLAALGVSRNVAIQFLTRAIEADPDFALAYSLRAVLYVVNLPRNLGAPGAASRVTEQEGLARADLARALALDPNLAQAHASNAWIDAYNWRGRAARDNFERAYQLSPNDPTILTSYGTFSAYSGEIEKAISLHARALELDPNSSLYGLAHTHQLAGNNEAAAAAYREELAREAPDARAQVNLALLEVARGNVAASDIGLTLAREDTQSVGLGVFTPQVAFAYAQLGLNDEAEILLAEFDERAEQNRQSAATWVIAHLARGDAEQALESLKRVTEKTPYEGYNLVFRIKANIFGSAILDQPEFVAVRERLGFTDL